MSIVDFLGGFLFGAFTGASGKYLADKFNVDYDELTAATDAKKKPEDIVKEVMNENKGVSNDTTDPANPSFIPPNQRSGATKRLASQSVLPE